MNHMIFTCWIIASSCLAQPQPPKVLTPEEAHKLYTWLSIQEKRVDEMYADTLRRKAIRAEELNQGR